MSQPVRAVLRSEFELGRTVKRVSRIGVVGDVHCDHIILEQALTHLKALSPDALLCVGDVADGVGDFTRCVELLQGYDVITVKGNHDRWLVTTRKDMDRDIPDLTWPEDVSQETLKFVEGLPVTEDFITPSGKVLLCHGIGDYDMGGMEPGQAWYDIRSLTGLHDLADSGEYAFIINGHTHVPMVEAFRELVIINAGTVVKDQSPVCLLVDFSAMNVHFFDISSDLMKERVEKIYG